MFISVTWQSPLTIEAGRNLLTFKKKNYFYLVVCFQHYLVSRQSVPQDQHAILSASFTNPSNWYWLRSPALWLYRRPMIKQTLSASYVSLFESTFKCGIQEGPRDNICCFVHCSWYLFNSLTTQIGSAFLTSVSDQPLPTDGLSSAKLFAFQRNSAHLSSSSDMVTAVGIFSSSSIQQLIR